MTKTLRITSVLIAVSTVIYLVFPAVSEVFGSDKGDDVLTSQSIVEQFRNSKGGNTRRDSSDDSPLVKQAYAYALYLNPPKPPAPRRARTPQSTPTAVTRPRNVSVKFKLIGTSYHESQPELSIALIDQPGKGFKWVRESSKVGHLVIGHIADGSITVKDGERTSELVAERVPRKSLLRNSKAGSDHKTGSSTISSVSSISPDVGEVYEPEPDAASQVNEAQAAIMEEFMKRVQADQSGRITDGVEEDNADAAFEEMVAKLRAPRVDSNEAQQLDRLGKELKNVSSRDANDSNRRKATILKRAKAMRQRRGGVRSNK